MDRNLLPALAAFAQVARDGSFTRAADRMNISTSALSQSIRSLENRLAIRLLNRSTRSISLTEAGSKLLKQIEPALSMIENGMASALDADNRPEGLVRINASRVAANYLLEPHLGEFHQLCPDVELDIFIDDSFEDIVREGFDAGIRLRDGVVDSMVAIPISPPISMAVVATPTYFAANPPPQTPDDLTRHNCIGFRHGKNIQISPWEFDNPTTGAEILFEPKGSFATNGDELMLSAALQGVGLVMHFDFVVQKQLTSGELVRVLKPWCKPFDGFDIYLPSREHMPTRLRALIDFLTAKRRMMET
ncbi:LysR substrate binding domain protein [Ruegeria sp. TrichCH4B]|jgi:DNA-binding transcriptional LysR family regulator|nr:LysR substrate binding domain protein [Ruegeria sp. TrichCH4B]